MLDFQIPRITSESVEQNRGTFTIEPRFSSTDSLVIRGIWKSSIRVLTSVVVGPVPLRDTGSGAPRTPMCGRATL